MAMIPTHLGRMLWMAETAMPPKLLDPAAADAAMAAFGQSGAPCTFCGETRSGKMESGVIMSRRYSPPSDTWNRYDRVRGLQMGLE